MLTFLYLDYTMTKCNPRNLLGDILTEFHLIGDNREYNRNERRGYSQWASLEGSKLPREQ